jgi:hypothetical protein
MSVSEFMVHRAAWAGLRDRPHSTNRVNYNKKSCIKWALCEHPTPPRYDWNCALTCIVLLNVQLHPPQMNEKTVRRVKIRLFPPNF